MNEKQTKLDNAIADLFRKVKEYHDEKKGGAIPQVVMLEHQEEDRKIYNRFLVINALGWGFGKTIVEAKKNALKDVARAERKVLINRAKLVAEETTCDSGGLSYFAQTPPIELGEV